MKEKDIYLIGIGGIAMGSLACMLQEQGFCVSGSDAHVYPPMSDILSDAGITVHDGFSESNINSPELVIVGNAISRGNPELEHVLNNTLPYMSMAGALHSFFLHDKEVIAVCGTHGKTTTTALLAHIMTCAELSPSFFIGGVARNYDSNYGLGTGRYFIIEGDEYDSAFFEKVPKFMLYRPHHAILTSLEYDHADIYSSLDEIKLWFRRLVTIIPSGGTLVYAQEYPALKDVVQSALSRTVSFNEKEADAWYEVTGHDGLTTFLHLHTPHVDVRLETSLFGRINYCNITAAATMALSLGVPIEAVQQGVASFKGVKRRQELIFHKGSVRIYEDFAHHPTAIRGVLETMKERFPGAQLWAVYEPRSATSRRNVFQDSLAAAFHSAHEVMIHYPYRSEALADSVRLDVDAVCADIIDQGGGARAFGSVENIVDYVGTAMDISHENIVVIMSNGGFDNIYSMIIHRMNSFFSDNLCGEASNR